MLLIYTTIEVVESGCYFDSSFGNYLPAEHEQIVTNFCEIESIEKVEELKQYIDIIEYEVLEKDADGYYVSENSKYIIEQRKYGKSLYEIYDNGDKWLIA